MDKSIKPFKISIPDSDLTTLRQKLELTRLPPPSLAWKEENGLDSTTLRPVLEHWLTTYDWRAEESRINAALPQYTTSVQIQPGAGAGEGNAGFELQLHFVHSPAGSDRKKGALLFLHGWPGSFLEISKGLGMLNEAGFDIVAPSLPGYGFSTYPPHEGFDHRGHARVLDEVMVRLGYGDGYVVQGGDWGSSIARTMGVMFPDRVKGVHVNMLATPHFDDLKSDMTPHEAAVLDREKNYFLAANAGYTRIQAQRPITLGYAMHDSPLGLLAYIADKLITWSDAYPWTPAELITWTLMHYFPGPTTGFIMYHENNPSPLNTTGSGVDGYMDTPLGVSSFPKELVMKPRAWAEKVANVVQYKEHNAGGHFAMWEVPDVLVGDVVEFVGKLQR